MKLSQEAPLIQFSSAVEARLQQMREDVIRLTEANRRDPLKYSELQAAKDRLTAYSLEQKLVLKRAAQDWIKDHKVRSERLHLSREGKDIKCGWPRSMDPYNLEEPLRSEVFRQMGIPLPD